MLMDVFNFDYHVPHRISTAGGILDTIQYLSIKAVP
jgi:hypothetical protein